METPPARGAPRCRRSTFFAKKMSDDTWASGRPSRSCNPAMPSRSRLPAVRQCPPGLSEHESLHTTFDYQPRSDTWRLTIDDVKDGKTDRFGDMKLTRTPPQ